VKRMGIYFLALVVLLGFVYLGYALFKPEKF
jgi:K+-transporting ATPase KdpF subunit